MTGDILVIGYGPVGRATVAALRGAGGGVRLAQRSRPTDLPEGVAFAPCDVLDAASVRSAAKGADQVVLAVGFAYDGPTWRRAWPATMTNLLDACAETGARIVFFDNLYMYGPQRAPLVETMPLTDQGMKPAVRAAITRQWMADARNRVAALRASDFYGPGVLQSHLGATGLAAIAQAKAATFAVSPDHPHDFAYVPDIGRAIVTLLGADDSAFGQAWHMPNAPTRTAREVLTLGAEAVGARPRINALPALVADLLAPFVAPLREAREMRFQWDRPYHVDASKWTARFWSDVTPFEVGVPRTMASFAPGLTKAIT